MKLAGSVLLLFAVMALPSFVTVVAQEGGTNVNVMANNVVIVLDASGSMSEQMRTAPVRKMEAAKTALREVLARVPADTQIGLLVFSTDNSHAWRFPLGPRNDAIIRQALDQTAPGGGTPLGEYIALATRALLDQREKQMGYGTYRLLVVTDGEASDAELMERTVREAVRGGMRLDVIGVDMAGRHTLATRAHSYRRADDPKALKRAVADVFAEVGGKSAGDAGADAFSELASIPVETAAEMIKALNAKPSPLPPFQHAATSGTGGAGGVPPAATPSAGGNSDGGWGKYIGLVIVLIILSKLFKKRHG